MLLPHNIEPTMATEEDRRCEWHWAFAYADQFDDLDATQAANYANHYCERIADEENMNRWPSHPRAFAEWRTDNVD